VVLSGIILTNLIGLTWSSVKID